MDPIGSSSVRDTIVDLAIQGPGIAVSRLAVLLNLDSGIVREIAEKLRNERGIQVDLEG